MTRPHSDVPAEHMRYGLGFWLHPSGPALILIGSDAGVAFRSVHNPRTSLTHTTISNTSDAGTWPLITLLDDILAT